MPVHGFRTPLWVEDLFGQNGSSIGQPTHQSSATVTLQGSGLNQTPFPGYDTLRQGHDAARRAVQVRLIPHSSMSMRKGKF